MATQTKFAEISNLDQLNEGYHNDVATQTLNMTMLNHVKSLIDHTGVYSADTIDLWGDAYVDSNGRNNCVDADKTSAIFDTNKYKAGDPGQPFVQIEATSISATGDFAINDCVISLISAGVWRLECTTGSNAVRRAQIYKTLFYGTDGSNPRAHSLFITTPTAMKTTITRDVGKRGHYASYSVVGLTSGANETYTGTYVDTTTNTDCSAWSYCQATSANGVTSVEFPGGTTVNSVTTSGAVTSDETGTDVEGDEDDNPATIILRHVPDDTTNFTTRIISLAVGTMTWAASPSRVQSNTDFYVDNSIPVFTLATETYESVVVHDIPAGTFGATVQSVFGAPFIWNWEAGANIQYKLLNATENSGWIDYSEMGNFRAFTSEPTLLHVKLIPKTTAPSTNYPAIRGFVVRAK